MYIYSFTLLQNYSFVKSQMEESTQYLPFWIWPVSLSVSHSDCIHFAAENITSFFFMAEESSQVMPTTYPYLLSADGHQALCNFTPGNRGNRGCGGLTWSPCWDGQAQKNSPPSASTDCCTSGRTATIQASWWFVWLFWGCVDSWLSVDSWFMLYRFIIKG